MEPKSVRTAWKGTLAAVAAASMLMSTALAVDQYKVPHYFYGKPGLEPYAGLVSDSAGNLYGTTLFSTAVSCGNVGCGVVFKVTRESNDRWIYSVIHQFNGTDGRYPYGGLTLDSSGNLYGTTFAGGAHDSGTVFELSFSGEKWKEKVLHSFGTTSGDLAGPWGTLSLDASGNLYGPTISGGTSNSGGIFELQRSSRGWKEKVIYGFTGGRDGGRPLGKLVWDSAGNLYGTTQFGGSGSGVVFELTPKSDGVWAEAVLYSFTGGADGSNPLGGVTLDSSGNLYGATPAGGQVNCGSGGCGTIFELTPSSNLWTFNVLHTFNDSDGNTPYAAPVLDAAGNLFGTTILGGQHEAGVVFKLSPSGNGWTEKVLHQFDGNDGLYPYGALIFDKGGVFYGTAELGGKGPHGGYGFVFSVIP